MTAAAFSHDSPVAVVLAKLPKAKKSGGGWIAPCPAHADSNPSLSISVGDDGRCLLKCHAGCEVSAIVGALGLTESDLFPPREGPRRRGEGPRFVCAYDYHDEEGRVRFQVVRLREPKKFFQRHADPSGEWINEMDGVERVLYHLPEIIAAKRESKIIFLVEGEKDADNLRALGFKATTNPGGGGKWLPQYTDTLTGADVILCPDNDPTGTKHRDLVASKLDGFAKTLRIMEVPAPHKDISDWIRAGAIAEDIRALAVATPKYVAADPDVEPITRTGGPPVPDGTEPPATKEKPKKIPLTDIGNAERLVLRHGNDLHFVPAWDSWLVWDEKRWLRDETKEVERRAKDTIRSIGEESKQGLMKAEERERLFKFAKKSESNSAVNNLIARTKAEPGVAITTRHLDRDPWALNVANGTLDLRTAEIRPHDPTDLMTKVVPVAYDAEAACPQWLAFLGRIMGGNATLIDYLKRAIGYALTGHTSEQCFFFLHGVGANGKTTFLEILRMIAGDYATQADFTTFIEKKGDGPRNDVARLFGARVVTSSEVGEGKRLNESLIKSLTGSEIVAARFLYAETFEFMPTFKLFLAANHKPIIRGTDEGIWRRVRMIPFAVQIPAAEQDKDLLAKLKTELPGILAWAIDGCQLWLEQGLGLPQEVRAAVANYRAESDTLGAFIEEYCELGPALREPSKLLYQAYQQWAREGGEYQMTQTAFGRRLEERGIRGEKDGTGANRKMWRLGIRLTTRPTGDQGPPQDHHEPADRGDDQEVFL